MERFTLKFQTDRLIEWLVDGALPLWAERARDSRGGFYEHLNLDGTPDPNAIRRLRVQARQVFTYALAIKRGWYHDESVPRDCFQFMVDVGYQPDGKPGFIHLLNPDYSVNDDTRDLYDHAFYLLSCAALSELGQDRAPVQLASEVLEMLNRDFKSPHGGWAETSTGGLPRRQNPHMHLFETAMTWSQISDNPVWREKAKHIYGLFGRHFFDREHEIVREYFENDWSLFTGDKGQSAEPGHAAEWVWLLRFYERISGVNTSSYANVLYTQMLTAPEQFLNDEQDVRGRVIRGTKRLWCQTELIKAHLVQAERGDPASLEMATAAMDGFYHTYLKSDGTWNDQFDAKGVMIAKTIPTSTFYHIIVMIDEARRILERL